jgi:hypothetical protein
MANIQSIVAELKQERDRLSQAIAALESIGASTSTGHTSIGGKRKVSALARRRMAQAQRARWAKVQSHSARAGKTISLATPKRTLSASARRKIAAAQRARWARFKAQQGKKTA